MSKTTHTGSYVVVEERARVTYPIVAYMHSHEEHTLRMGWLYTPLAIRCSDQAHVALYFAYTVSRR